MLGRLLKQPHRKGQPSRGAARLLEQEPRRVEAVHLGYFAAIQRQVGAGADPDLDHAPDGALGHLTPERQEPLGRHGVPDQPRDDDRAVKSQAGAPG
jgi:hypothetical protein